MSIETGQEAARRGEVEGLDSGEKRPTKTTGERGAAGVEVHRSQAADGERGKHGDTEHSGL